MTGVVTGVYLVFVVMRKMVNRNCSDCGGGGGGGGGDGGGGGGGSGGVRRRRQKQQPR